MKEYIVKPLPKGQITIPAELRKQIGMSESTVFKVVVQGSGLYLEPVHLGWEQKFLREYSPEYVKELAKDDKIDKKTLEAVEHYFKS